MPIETSAPLRATPKNVSPFDSTADSAREFGTAPPAVIVMPVDVKISRTLSVSTILKAIRFS